MSADAFYLDGGGDYAGESDYEPQVAESLEQLSFSELDELAQRQYGLSSWGEVEQLWEQQDAEAAARVEAEHVAKLEQGYGDARLGQITREEVDRLGGLEQIHLPDLHGTAAGLLQDREWLRQHDTLEGEPLIAAAVREAADSLKGSEDEFAALRRRELRMRSRGLTVRGEPDDGTR